MDNACEISLPAKVSSIPKLKKIILENTLIHEKYKKISSFQENDWKFEKIIERVSCFD